MIYLSAPSLLMKMNMCSPAMIYMAWLRWMFSTEICTVCSPNPSCELCQQLGKQCCLQVQPIQKIPACNSIPWAEYASGEWRHLQLTHLQQWTLPESQREMGTKDEIIGSCQLHVSVPEPRPPEKEVCHLLCSLWGSMASGDRDRGRCLTRLELGTQVAAKWGEKPILTNFNRLLMDWHWFLWENCIFTKQLRQLLVLFAGEVLPLLSLWRSLVTTRPGEREVNALLQWLIQRGFSSLVLGISQSSGTILDLSVWSNLQWRCWNNLGAFLNERAIIIELQHYRTFQVGKDL